MMTSCPASQTPIRSSGIGHLVELRNSDNPTQVSNHHIHAVVVDFNFFQRIRGKGCDQYQALIESVHHPCWLRNFGSFCSKVTDPSAVKRRTLGPVTRTRCLLTLPSILHVSSVKFPSGWKTMEPVARYSFSPTVTLNAFSPSYTTLAAKSFSPNLSLIVLRRWWLVREPKEVTKGLVGSDGETMAEFFSSRMMARTASTTLESLASRFGKSSS